MAELKAEATLFLTNLQVSSLFEVKMEDLPPQSTLSSL